MSIVARQRLYRERAAFGLIDDIGGVATLLLAVLGLAGLYAPLLAAIATIIFGVALLVQGRALLTLYTQASVEAAASASAFGVSVRFAVVLLGAAGAALGVLSLLDFNSAMLTPVASIMFGAGLVLSGISIWHLNAIRRASAKGGESLKDIVANHMVFDSLSVQIFAGLAAIILGVLAASGATYDLTFTLVALLMLGSALVLKGGSLNAILLSFMRPA